MSAPLIISSWYALEAGESGEGGERGGAATAGGGDLARGVAAAGGGDLAGLAWPVWVTAISSRRLVTARGGRGRSVRVQVEGGVQHTLQALAAGGESGTAAGAGGLTGSCS